mmetsp:Transcript_10053/g.25977  ORF Transcript_10053/g.25977 Transcript_10053/m.25977 type:complete len:325 (+) Transcript_10053:568-1542(+)
MVRLAIGVLLGDPLLEEEAAAALQDLPLHGAHASGLGRSDLKVLVVEQFDAIDERRVLLYAAAAHCREELLGVSAPVEAKVEARERDFLDGVAASAQPREVRLRVVERPPEARLEGHHVDAFAARRRGSLHRRRQLAGVAEVAVQHPAGRERQVAGHHGQDLATHDAAVVIDIRPEEKDRVDGGGKRDALLQARQRVRRRPVLGLQRHHGGAGAQERHSPKLAPAPGAKVVPQDRVIGHGGRVLVLLLVRQGKADQRRRALVQRVAEHVHARGLQQCRQRGEGLVGGLQEGLLRGVLARGVQPHDLSAAAGTEVALLHLHREPP